MERYKVDIEMGRVELLDARFYELHGEYFPSVTTILDAYPKGMAFYEWLKIAGEKADEIRDDFGKRGSVVHRLTEQYDLGGEVQLMRDNEPAYTSMEWAMFERYVEFTERFKPEILAVEMNLVSKELGYGGTLDRLMVINGKNTLIDIKTSNYLHNHFWLQLAAYKQLFEAKGTSETIEQIAILWLNAKTRTDGRGDAIQGHGWQLKFPDKSMNDYLQLFQATHSLWKVEFGTMKPRNTIYKISHMKTMNHGSKVNGKVSSI